MDGCQMLEQKKKQICSLHKGTVDFKHPDFCFLKAYLHRPHVACLTSVKHLYLISPGTETQGFGGPSVSQAVSLFSWSQPGTEAFLQSGCRGNPDLSLSSSSEMTRHPVVFPAWKFLILSGVMRMGWSFSNWGPLVPLGNIHGIGYNMGKIRGKYFFSWTICGSGPWATLWGKLAL